MTIVFYISGHGFGHASRCLELLNTLSARRTDLRFVVRSMVAPWLIEQTARPAVRLDRIECDTGIVQIDSLRLDVSETLRRAQAFMATLPARAAAEGEQLKALDAQLVVADIPALGIAAARHAGIPVVALGNFSWDWAYAAYEGGAEVAAQIAHVYAHANLALRLPLWGGFEAFPNVHDLPFIARRSCRDPAEVRAAFGFSHDERLALVSFGGYGVDGIDVDALSRVEGYRIIVGGNVPVGADREPLQALGPRGSLVPLDEAAMYARDYRYEDLVHAVDVVVTKPGYGIISECVANDTAMLYTSRGNFAEYDVLVAGLHRYLRAGFIGHDDLFAGRWQLHLDAVLAQSAPPEWPAVDGADVAADIVLNMVAAS